MFLHGAVALSDQRSLLDDGPEQVWVAAAMLLGSNDYQLYADSLIT